MKTVLDNRRTIASDEQRIYNHLLYWIEREPPEQMIQRFRLLFLEGCRYPDPEIATALDHVLSAPAVQESFPHILNRCCHILINRWQARTQFQLAIPLLVELFESVSEPSKPSNSVMRRGATYRLRVLVNEFRHTEQYATLRRLAQVLSESIESYAIPKKQPSQDQQETPLLGQLIRRYPYLYQHCLLSDHSTQEQQYTVQQVQARIQHQLELDLSRYVTSHVRRSRLHKQVSAERLDSLVKPVANPTLLSNRDLNRAIQHYSGRVIAGRSYRDTAQNFMLRSGQSQSYASFKDDLYHYIVSGIHPTYGQRQFNTQLHNHLQGILSHSDSKVVNDFLVVRTCSQLLNFLVVDNAKSPQHFVFIDLITNLGPILTMGLLLRIVLLCRKVRPYMERRFSILFNHYEYADQGAVQWLVNALEVLNIALVANFGNLDLSLMKR